ncbi:MAG: di-trans,poly-cis-decaprenylcistransferase [Coxiella sp. RIFCSPHIGHO2_12_FULL_42_15]|nr:MAG: di-trans,poly-cis-decaprenylcistransferase [Coxiella sp. RIFCSPHIGHO2_12_FULL_42_15]
MEQLPRHIAIIMDGNGRWAMQRNLRRVAGHRAGVKTVESIVQHCGNRGIEVLTLFAFSLENRRRPPLEVRFLMKLMSVTLQREIEKLHRNNVRLRIIGDRSYLDGFMQVQIAEAEQLTASNTGLTLVMSINYSGRWDIVQAIQKFAKAPVSLENQSDLDIEKSFQSYLSLSDLPEPDLLIRTSGEQRISNFMLWQMAYTELFFSELYWPDFTVQELERAMAWYCQRQRRFGLTSQQIEESQYA